MDAPCGEYEGGGALHIAAANLSPEAAGALLRFGADPAAADDLARTPAECVPDPEHFAAVPEAPELVGKGRGGKGGGEGGGWGGKQQPGEMSHFSPHTSSPQVLEMERLLSPPGPAPPPAPATPTAPPRAAAPVPRGSAVSGRTVLGALGLRVGDRVVLKGDAGGAQQQQQQQADRFGTLVRKKGGSRIIHSSIHSFISSRY